ncbi:MAG: pyrroloquinoline-quinone synthase PqqC [Proteobacteria bacterium]|nr:pyrroloquinoline-quinone synthase PqqC [Pseudomonadota bacterium]
MTRSAAEFEAALRRIGDERYHHRHPFNLRMHEGTLTRDEIQVWVRNRYYYQTRIPIKDGVILSKSRSADFRRQWIRRIRDHDGERPGEGGLELWLRLGEAVGLARDDLESLGGVTPGVRAACDAYVEFVQSHDLLESVAASLTELFAGDIMKTRIAAFEKHYPWVDAEGLRYFQSRTEQAPRDAREGLAFVLAEARENEDQERCLRALERKCEILWQLLDAVEFACSRPSLASAALVRFDPREACHVVVLPERAVKLSQSAHEILSLCDGQRSADQVARELRARHPDATDIEEDVHVFLEKMRGLGVLAHESAA